MNTESSTITIPDAEIEKMQNETFAYIQAEEAFASEQLEKAKEEITRLRSALSFAYRKLDFIASPRQWDYDDEGVETAQNAIVKITEMTKGILF